MTAKTQPSTWSLRLNRFFSFCLLACLLLGGPSLAQAEKSQSELEGPHFHEFYLIYKHRGRQGVLDFLQGPHGLYKNPNDVNSGPIERETRLQLLNDVLFTSFRYGDKKLADFALEQGATVTYWGYPILDAAFKKYMPLKTKHWHMISFGASLLEDKGKEWYTYALLRSMSFKKLKWVEKLIQGGADPNSLEQHSNNRYYPIIFSAPDKEMMLLLIQLGADINLKDYKGQTLLERLEKNPISYYRSKVMTSSYYRVEKIIELRKILKLPRNLELEAKLPALRKKRLEWEKQNPPGPELGY